MHRCRQIARQHSQYKLNCFPTAELFKLRQEYKDQVQKKEAPLRSTTDTIFTLFGFWDTDETMLELLNRACEHAQELGGGWFYYRDFNFYHTVIKPRIRMFRSPALEALVWLFLFYLGSAVLFCAIMEHKEVCPRHDEWYSGWLTSIYFASVTMVRSWHAMHDAGDRLAFYVLR